jgi:hypothetical protein
MIHEGITGGLILQELARLDLNNGHTVRKRSVTMSTPLTEVW